MAPLPCEWRSILLSLGKHKTANMGGGTEILPGGKIQPGQRHKQRRRTFPSHDQKGKRVDWTPKEQDSELEMEGWVGRTPSTTRPSHPLHDLSYSFNS